RSNSSSALTWACCRMKIVRIRSRLVDRLPPAGRRLERSGKVRCIETGGLARCAAADPEPSRRANSPTGQRSVDGERLTAAASGCGVRILDGKTAAGDRIDEIDLGAAQIPDADRVDEKLDPIRFEYLVAGALTVFFDHQTVLEA